MGGGGLRGVRGCEVLEVVAVDIVSFAAATPPLACIRPTSAALRVGVNVALASAKGSRASLVAGGTYARTLKQSYPFVSHHHHSPGLVPFL